MATRRPFVDPDGAFYQSRLAKVEQLVFHDGARLNECQEKASEAYREHSTKMFVRHALQAVKLFGTTQQQLAMWLDVDRSVISVAKNHGSLGPRPLVAILANHGVLQHFLDHYPAIRDRMGRAGFIAAATVIAEYIPADSQRAPMTTLDYELLCALMSTPEEAAKVATGLAETVIAKTLADIKSPRGSKAVARLHRLRDAEVAVSHLSKLRREWLDVFVCAWSIVEDLDTLPTGIANDRAQHRLRREPRRPPNAGTASELST